VKASEIGDTVATLCKWSRDRNPESDCLYRTSDGRGMFNPAVCMNAMHEAESMLTEKQRWLFMDHLLPAEESKTPYEEMWQFLHATAAQRADAFLKTFGYLTTQPNPPESKI
jgi:hypothetical protein